MMQLERVLIHQQAGNKRTKINLWTQSRGCQDTESNTSSKGRHLLIIWEVHQIQWLRFNISNTDICVTAGPEEDISHSH